MVKRKTRAARKQQLVAKLPVTRDYQPIMVHHWGIRPRDLPLFTFLSVQAMLYDPTIRLGLAMRAAPVYQTQFGYDKDGQWTPGIEAKNEAVGEFVYRQLQRIWHHECHALVKAQLWGHAAGEVLLRLTEDNLVEVDRLLERHPNDVRALKRAGQNVGIRISRLTRGTQGNLDLEWPKGYWTTFNAEPGTFYGTSILLGAYSPWYDKWCDGGALDVRRLYMHKDAYVGASIYYPEGDLYTMPDGSEVPARDLARQMIEQIVAGGVVALPSDLDEKGNRKWELKPATVASNPAHILKYPQDLDTEMLRGLEVPDDIFTADSTSSGAWAGKKVPLSAFYAGIDCWVVQIIKDLCRCIFEPLVMLNFGKAEEFQITHKPLGQQAMEQQNQPQGGQPPGQQQPGAAGMGGLFGGGGDEGGGQPGADQGGGGQQSLADLLGSPAAQQARQGGGQQAMSLEAAIGKGVIDAAKIVQASREQVDAALVRMAADSNPWVPYKGPKDGTGWINSNTGHVAYQVERPGAHETGQAENPDRHKPTATKPHVTETPEFKRWFGGSKVVDEHRKPLVVYHGSELGSEFGTNVNGHFFSTDPNYAEHYGSAVSPVFLKIERPLDWSHLTGEVRNHMTIDDVMRELETSGIDASLIDTDAIDEDRRFHPSEAFYDPLGDIPDGIIKAAIDAGYDGVKLPSEEPDGQDTVWIAFDSRQIKSASGNRGTFDPDDPDIRMAASSPREGERNAEGLIFHNSRWHREEELRGGGGTTPASSTPATAATNEAHVAAYQKGDNRAAANLLKQNAGLIYNMAKKFAKHYDELDDLQQEARIAVLHAAKAFDPSKGFQFSTLATRSIINRLSNVTGRTRKRKGVWQQTPEDEEGNRPEPSVRPDRLPTEEREQQASVLKAVESLPDRTREIVKRRYGLDGEPAESASDIGRRIGLSPQRVSKILDGARDHLRSALQDYSIQLAIRMAGDSNPWVAYKGPRGGTGWVHSGTQDVRYVKERPGAHETGGSEKAETPSAPATESKPDRPSVGTSPPAPIPDKSELDSWEGDRWKVAMNAIVRAKQKGGTIHQSRDEAGNLNGIALTVPEERYVAVDMLATKERGHGRKMMATICDQAAKAGKGVSLLAARSAVGFYEKLGMHRSGFDFWFTAAEAAAFVGMASEALGATKMSLDDIAEFEPEDGVFVDNQTDEERAIQKPVRMAGEVNPWTPYKGKHGGQGWVRSDTKEVRYQKDRPGVHEGAPGAPVDQQAPAAKPPQTPQELNQALDAVAANPQAHGLDQATAAKLQQAGTPKEKIAVLDEATGHKFDQGGAAKPEAAPAQQPQPAAATPPKPAAPPAAKPSPEAEKYLTAANANLQKISRTAQGKVDVSASKEKAGKMQVGSGEEAANLAKTNFARTMTSLHEQRGRKFANPQEAVDFCDSVNRSINQGITKSGVLLRTDDSEKYPYTDVAKLHKAREQFGKEFAQRLDNSDPREMAAWVHWRLNMTDHPYADGVGKTSEALANWVLMRAGQPLPQIDSRQNWFAAANKQKADPDNASTYYHDGYAKWVNYYGSLFEDKKKITPATNVDSNGITYGTRGGWEWNGPALSHEAMDKLYPQHPEALKSDVEDSQFKHRGGPPDHEGRPSGAYTPQRQALHKTIIDRHFEGKQPVAEGEQPTYLFLGGGTAAGKSTVLRSGAVKVPKGAVTVDSDEIKNALPEFQRHSEDRRVGAAGIVHEESSDVSKMVNSRALEGRYHAVMDGTGDTSIESIQKKVGKARKAGHKIVATYMTNDIEKAVENAKKRASRPPYRMVSMKATLKIHAGVSKVFPQAVAAGLFDEVTLWDTNGDKPVLVASGKGKDLQIHDQAAYDKFLAKQNLLETHKHLIPEHE